MIGNGDPTDLLEYKFLLFLRRWRRYDVLQILVLVICNEFTFFTFLRISRLVLHVFHQLSIKLASFQAQRRKWKTVDTRSWRWAASRSRSRHHRVQITQIRSGRRLLAEVASMHTKINHKFYWRSNCGGKEIKLKIVLTIWLLPSAVASWVSPIWQGKEWIRDRIPPSPIDRSTNRCCISAMILHEILTSDIVDWSVF